MSTWSTHQHYSFIFNFAKVVLFFISMALLPSLDLILLSNWHLAPYSPVCCLKGHLWRTFRAQRHWNHFYKQKILKTQPLGSALHLPNITLLVLRPLGRFPTAQITERHSLSLETIHFPSHSLIVLLYSFFQTWETPKRGSNLHLDMHRCSYFDPFILFSSYFAVIFAVHILLRRKKQVL